MTDKERTLAALRKVGARGLTVRDFDPARDGHVIDGGAEFTRLHARILDLRQDGHEIITVRGKPYCRYVLTHLARSKPVVENLGDGWVRTFNCRRCDFHFERPCGPVCPTCEQPTRRIVLLDARGSKRTNERQAA